MLPARYNQTVVVKVLTHNVLSKKQVKDFILAAAADRRATMPVESPLRDLTCEVQNMSDFAKLVAPQARK